jgi:ankyrin
VSIASIRAIDAYFTNPSDARWVVDKDEICFRSLSTTEKIQAYTGKGPASLAKVAEFCADTNIKDLRLVTLLEEYNKKHRFNPFKWIPRKILCKIKDVNSCDTKGNTALHIYSMQGNIAQICQLTTNPLMQNNDGDTALHVAIRAKEREVVSYLLKTATLVHRVNFAHDSPLHTAAKCGDKEIVSMLLAAGASKDAVNKEGFLPWQIAKKNLFFSLAVSLKQESGPIGETSELHQAVIGENTQKVIDLLRTRKDLIDLQDEEGRTALHIASLKGDSIIVRYLLQNNASVNPQDKNDRTPLHVARGDARELLLQKTVDVDIVDCDKRSVAFYAIEEGNEEYACKLIEKMNILSVCDCNGDTLLHRAIIHRQARITHFLLIKKADPNKKNQAGSTPLHSAIELGQLEIAKALIGNGGRVNDLNEHGQNAFHIACRHGFKEFAIYLQAQGAKSDTIDKFGYSPLHLACVSGHSDLVHYLLDSATTGPHGETLLHRVAEGGSKELGEDLIRRGFAVRTKDLSGQTALHYAARRNNLTVLQWLLSKDPGLALLSDMQGHLPIHYTAIHGNLDAFGILAQYSSLDVSILHLALKHRMNQISIALIDRRVALDAKATEIASETGNLTLVQMLNQRGAPVGNALHKATKMGHKDVVEYILTISPIDVVNEKRETALHIACREGDKELIQLLKQKGASWKAKDEKGRTPFHFLAKKGHAKIIQSLLPDAKIPLNTEDNEKNRPLHLAAKHNCYFTSQVLIQNSCDVFARNALGETALHMAIKRGHEKLAEFLGENGLSFSDEDNTKKNCLHKAVLFGDPSLVQFVHKRQVALGARDIHGHTALIMAAQSGNKAVVEYLVENGAVISETDDKKQTALHKCSPHGHEEVAKYLLEHGASRTAVDSKNQTALHLAIQHDQTTLALILIEQNKALDLASSPENETALHMAVGRKNIAVTNKLLEKGANPNCKNHLLQTALHIATTREVIDTLFMYTRIPIDVTARDFKNETAYERNKECF